MEIELKIKNFDFKTGKKINPTCRYCWVKKQKNYTCGYEHCPGTCLFLLEKLKFNE